MKSLLRIVVLVLISSSVFAAPATLLKNNYPERYVVKDGDTLWEIANKFLQQPWRWRELWRENPQIQDPNRLFPGDVLVIRYQKGKPVLTRLGPGVYKLSPQSRPKRLGSAVPTIPLGAIKPFLNGSIVMDHDQLRDAAYVVAYAGNHLIAGPDVEVYVKNLAELDRDSYSFFRPGGEYIHPDTKESLGFLAVFVGRANIVKAGNPATLVVREINRGVKIRDRVIGTDNSDFDAFFQPTAPAQPIDGEIIDLFGALTQAGTNQVVVINRGERDGLEAGNVLAIAKGKRVVKDPIHFKEQVLLPAERVGELMVFRTFKKVSFALIMNSTDPIKKSYPVTNP